MVNDERQRAVEKLVAEGLKRGLKAGGEACPDSGTIAAYVDQALSPRERASFETHAAACRRCQEAVGTLARLAVHDEPARAAALPKQRVFAVWRWAWAAPLLLAVVIVGVWSIGGFRTRLAEPQFDKVSPAAPSQPTAAPKASAPAKVAPAPQATASRQERSMKPLEKQAPAAGPRKDTLREEKTEQAKSDVITTPAPSPPPATPTSAANNIATTGGMATPSVRAKLAAPPSTPQATTLGAPQGAGAGGVTSSATSAAETAQTKTHAEAPLPKPASAEGRDKKTEAVTGALAREKGLSTTQSVEVTAAPAMGLGVRPANKFEGSAWTVVQTRKAGTWRVGPGGGIERLGKHHQWAAVASGVTMDFYALAFFDASEGWITGQSGTVLRSNDGGKTWTAVTSPTTSDLVQVIATAESAAQVTARDGSIFSTTDGGATWTQLPHNP